jgi:hypothetical protein
MRPSADWIGRLLKKRMSLRGGPEGPPVFVEPGAAANYPRSEGPPVFVEPGAAANYPRSTLNLVCSRCGYRLRGIDPEGRCPECGQDVAETLAANDRYRQRLFAAAWRLKGVPLSRADKAWLSRVARAAYALAGVQVCFVLWALYRQSMGWTARLPDALLVALAAAYAWALWQLTVSEQLPDGTVERKNRGTRESLRVLSFGPLLAASLAQASELVEFSRHEPLARIALVPAATFPLIAFHQFGYLSYLAARARGRWEVVVFRVARFAAAAWLAGSGLLSVGAGGRVPDMAAAAVGVLFAYGGLGAVCYGVVCVLTLRVARRLQVAARVTDRA